MKYFLYFLFLLLTASCVTNRVTKVPNHSNIADLADDRIQILGEVTGNSAGGRLWVLFIPLGMAQDDFLEGRAYKKALKFYDNANGLLDQVNTMTKTTIPLILVTPQVKAAKVKGVAYHIRTDIELEEYQKEQKRQQYRPNRYDK